MVHGCFFDTLKPYVYSTFNDGYFELYPHDYLMHQAFGDAIE